MATDTTARVWDALERVMDPEIPVVSIVEMGMVHGVDVAGSRATVTILPTFTGCPAVPVIREDVAAAVASVEGVQDVEVEFCYQPPWTSDRISEEGRKKLAGFGIAPPTGEGPVLIGDIGMPAVVACPFCGNRETTAENHFGPTPCRAIYHCASCSNPFEVFKPI